MDIFTVTSKDSFCLSTLIFIELYPNGSKRETKKSNLTTLRFAKSGKSMRKSMKLLERRKMIWNKIDVD